MDLRKRRQIRVRSVTVLNNTPRAYCSEVKDTVAEVMTNELYSSCNGL